MKIEIKLLQKGIQSNYIKSIRHITKCFIVNNDSSRLVDDTITVLINSHHERLLVHTGLTKQTFNALYKSTYLLDQFPPPVPPLQKIHKTGQEKEEKTMLQCKTPKIAVSLHHSPLNINARHNHPSPNLMTSSVI
eukprot:11532459-Ditylum_brightwellii.AAC.1